MALVQILGETFSSQLDGTEVEVFCTVEDQVVGDEGLISLMLLGKVRRIGSDETIETFECRVEARFTNPIWFTTFSSVLLPYGACVVVRAIAALIEIANDAYESTKLPGRGAWRSLEETASVVAKEVVSQTPKLRGKVLGSLIVCMPIAGVVATAT